MYEIKAVTGGVNTSQAEVLANVRSALRRQLPQMRAYQPNQQAVALICGGPSLLETMDELRDAVFRGASVVTVNGSHEWAIRQNLKPSLAILLDARPGNADFLKTPVPSCKYFLASQCAPETFDMVEGRDVTVFHALSYEEPERLILDAHYGKGVYLPIDGGTTVTMRALTILIRLGFSRIDVFGFDSCWMDGKHHGYAQAMNDDDRRMPVTLRVGAKDDRQFVCAPWHLRQLEDFKMWVRDRGEHLVLNVHGDGLIAHVMKTGARLVEEQEPEPIAVG